MCSDQQPAARSSTQKIKGWCGWRSTATAQQYMDCQQAEGISKNPWVPLPPNPAKKVPVSKKATTELRELWPPTAIINRCHPAPKSPQVDKRVQRQRLIPPREAGSRGPRPGESKRGRRPDQGHKGWGGGKQCLSPEWETKRRDDHARPNTRSSARQLAWQKSRSLASNLHVPRSEAHRAILKLLLMARDRCCSYHIKTAAMDSIAEAVAKLDAVDW